jgi:hypothetical protein
MSKLNRSEFKELLTEWCGSFVNERSFKSLDIPEWGMSISSEQKEGISSVNFDAEMINFPIPNELLFLSKNKKLNKIFQNQFSIFEKNEENFKLIKDSIKSFYKTVVLNPRSYKKSLLQNYKDTFEHEPNYEEKNITFNHKEEVDKESVLDNIDSLFEEKKDVLTGKIENDDVPIFIYLTKAFSDFDSMATGGLFKIVDLDERVSNSFLKWLFHHDFYHFLEGYSSKKSGKQIRSLERPSLDIGSSEHYYYYIKIKGLEESLGSDDNYASVIPYILTKSIEEAKIFLEENYLSYDEYKKLAIEDEVLKTVDIFNQEKEKNIDKILTDLVELQNNFSNLLNSLKDYIVIGSYEIAGSKTIEVQDLPSTEDPDRSKYSQINFRNISEENLDRIIDHAISNQDGNLLRAIALSNWPVGICSKKSQEAIINMDISNKASFDIASFFPEESINGKKYIVIDIVKHTKHQDVVELACKKYYNSFEIESGEFVKAFRQVVEENWPQIDTSKFLNESMLKNYITLILS